MYKPSDSFPASLKHHFSITLWCLSQSRASFSFLQHCAFLPSHLHSETPSPCVLGFLQSGGLPARPTASTSLGLSSSFAAAPPSKVPSPGAQSTEEVKEERGGGPPPRRCAADRSGGCEKLLVYPPSTSTSPCVISPPSLYPSSEVKWSDLIATLCVNEFTGAGCVCMRVGAACVRAHMCLRRRWNA